MRPTLLLAALPLALAACQQSSSDTTTEPSAAETLPAESNGGIGTSAPDAATSAAPTPTDTPGISEGGIPVALQGNWGMVPADCTSTRGDAKGLLRISATTLTFYESVGKLGTIKDRSDKLIRADFAFSGEGMTWTRDETLALSNDDKQLTRTERGGDEPGGPFTYKKCAG